MTKVVNCSLWKAGKHRKAKRQLLMASTSWHRRLASVKHLGYVFLQALLWTNICFYNTAHGTLTWWPPSLHGSPDTEWGPETLRRGLAGAGTGRAMPSQKVKAGTHDISITWHQPWCPPGSVFLAPGDTKKEEATVVFQTLRLWAECKTSHRLPKHFPCYLVHSLMRSQPQQDKVELDVHGVRTKRHGQGCFLTHFEVVKRVETEWIFINGERLNKWWKIRTTEYW